MNVQLKDKLLKQFEDMHSYELDLKYLLLDQF